MFIELLKRLGSTLGELKIPYMIIGGQAVLLYGEPRLTRDIDITLGIGVEDLEILKTAVKKLNLTILVKSFEKFVKKTMVLPTIDDKTGIRVDFILSWSAYEREAITRARDIKIGRVTVKFSSPEDLIIHKIIAGRQRDIEDIQAILLKNPAINRTFIKKYLAEFDASLGKDFQRSFQNIEERLRH